MVCCSITSLAVGYIYLSCSHLHSFASYDRLYALKFKYPVTRGYQFLLDVVFRMLLYERFSTFCTFTASLLYEHCLDHFVGFFFLAVIFYISEFSFCFVELFPSILLMKA